VFPISASVALTYHRIAKSSTRSESVTLSTNNGDYHTVVRLINKRLIYPLVIQRLYLRCIDLAYRPSQ